MSARRNYGNNKRVYQPRRKRFTKMDRVRKLAGTQPETTIDKIANGVGTVATIAKTVAGIVSMINTEDKYIDTSLLGNLTPAGAYSIPLNLCAQGSDYFQRNGNKILNKCLQINFQVTQQQPFTIAQTLRLAVVIDKKPQLGPLLWSQVYTPLQTTGMIDKNNMGDRVVILKDYKITLFPGMATEMYKKFYTPLDRLHTQYFGPNANDFESGKIYIIGMAAAPGAVPVVAIEGIARFCYTDN